VAALLGSLHVTMDHRVKPGGDDREGTCRVRHCERSEAIQWACAGSWIASSLSLLARRELHPRPRSETERGGGPYESWRGGRAASQTPVPTRCARATLCVAFFVVRRPKAAYAPFPLRGAG